MSIRLSKFTGGLTVGRKLALIYFLDLTTVLFISGILINEKYIAINFAKKESVGNAYIASVQEALLAVVEFDARAPLRAASAPAARMQLLAGRVASAESRFGEEMGSAELSRNFGASLAAPAMTVGKNDQATGEPNDEHARRLAIGRALLTRIGNQSNLILDPDLDSYYTMSLVVLRFPELLEVIDGMQMLSSQIASSPLPARSAQQTTFLILEGRIDSILAGIDSDYSEAFQASSPALKAHLAPTQGALRAALIKFRLQSHRRAGIADEAGGPAIGTDVGSATSVGTDGVLPVLTALGDAWSAAQADLERLLGARNDRAFNRMWLHLGTALLLMTLILTLVILVARQIAVPIRQLATVAERVRRSGDYTLQADWVSSDEIGRLVAGFNGMLKQLDAQRVGQQDLVAQASAAQAQRALIEAIPIPLMVTSIPDHRVLHANDAARSWLGGNDQDPWQQGMEPAVRARFFQTLSDTGTVDEFEVPWAAGATPSWALVSARRLDYQGQPAVLTTFTPMNRMKLMESRLKLWASVFEASSESIVVMDAHGYVLTVNQAFCRSTKFEMHEVIGKRPQALLAPRNLPNLMETVRHATLTHGSWQGEIWSSRKNGEPYPAWLVMNAVRDARRAVTHFIAMSLDITERKANAQRIDHLAHHDTLTGLPNRFSCGLALTASIQNARRRSSKVAVLFVDLDRFKNINDSLGHPIGDRLLCSVAGRLLASVREGDTVCRLGGDEFVIVLNNIVSADEIRKIVERRILPAVREPHQIDLTALYSSCSIGAAVFPDDSDNIEGLMRHADSAMYQAKKLGRNNFQFFTPEMNTRVTRQLHLESDLRHAAQRDQLVLYYQPRIDAASGRIAGVESLVRWQHPTEGLIAPVRFIPLAEESGLIVGIGAWVISEACRQHARWRQLGLGPMPISINLSALQLKDDSLVPTLMEAITSAGVPAAQIELELTESLLMDNVAATIVVLNRLKALGFSLSIDDFGTGYSSLNYLYRFPIDKLKIDRSFIQNIHAAPENLAVTKAIIGLGHTLGLEVVAEGVEHAADVDVLREAGCDELQGFYYAKPMPAEAFSTWLHAHRAAVF